MQNIEYDFTVHDLLTAKYDIIEPLHFIHNFTYLKVLLS